MNTVNWALWLLLATAFCTLTYNPLYQILLLLIISWVAVFKKLSLKSYLKMSLLMSFIPLLVNVLLVHKGKTIVYTIPWEIVVLSVRIPTLMLAGSITAQSAAFGLIMAVFITNMLIAFQVFSGATSAATILRLIPKQLTSVGLAVSIALRFIPSVIKDYSSITDAQRSRGVKITSGSLSERLANQLKILSPTVITSLERGFNLAESMASRGYTGQRTKYKKEVWTRTERLTQAAYALTIAMTVYAKQTGILNFWPYDSLNVQFSFIAVIPLVALAIPLFLKDENNRA
jgi:energy-coupling factor transport system permease protein